MSQELLPHQQRVVQEKEDLDLKRAKLRAFIGSNPQFDTLSIEQQELLIDQDTIMRMYSEVLAKRISLF